MIRATALPSPAQEPASAPASDYPDHLLDASRFPGKADRIFFPTTEEEVGWILRKAGQEKTPVTVSGAGTGLTGGRVPQGGFILCTERMNRILEARWNPGSGQGFLSLQPGVLLKEMDDVLDKKELFFPPDSGERQASIGGNVATNASGPRSYKYGPTRKYVRRLRVVLPNGDLLEVRRGEEKAQNGKFTIALSSGSAVVPVSSYPAPKSVKNAAGYFTGPGMDLVDLFVGAEGTLGVVTEIELEIFPKPESVLSGVLFFDNEKDCFRFALQSRGMEPRALEFFDSKSLAILSRKHADIPQRAGAALYFQRECLKEEQEEVLRRWTSEAEQSGARSSDCWFSHRPEDHKSFRKFRYDLPVLVNEQVARNGFRKLGTDFAVPESRAHEMFDYYLQEVPAAKMDYAIWGHLGDHHLHVNFLPKTAAEFERALAAYGKLARQAVKLKGTVSGEHGIGKARIPYLEMMVGREGLLSMARVKKALDPGGILNPGDIFPVELLKEVS